MDTNNINSRFEQMASDMAEFRASLKRIESALIGDEYHQGAIPELRERLTRLEERNNNHSQRIDRMQMTGLNAEEVAKTKQIIGFLTVWKLTLAGLVFVLPLIYVLISLFGG